MTGIGLKVIRPLILNEVVALEQSAFRMISLLFHFGVYPTPTSGLA